MSFEYDFVVVGSGFGGSVSALRLSEKGYRVAVVEMGKRYRPEDFAKTSWQATKFLWRPRLGCYGIMQMTLLRDVFVLHGAGVGGGSLVYANTLLEPPAEVFADPRWAGLDWRAALAPHYATAKRMFGVVEAPQLYAADRLLREVVTDMGRGERFHKTDVAVFFGEPGKTVPDPYFQGEGPPRTGCIHCGACMVGCRYGAKNTLDQNYLFLAERRGATVIAEHQVTDLVPIAGGGYALTLRRSTGWRHPTRVVRAREVVLAAGVLGTVPLLLSCKARGRLPKLSDRLGDFVRTNSETLLGVRSRRPEVDFSKGISIAAGAYVDDQDTHVEIVRYNEGSDAMGLLGTILTEGGGPWPRWLRWVATMLRHPLKGLRATIPFGWAKKTAILLVMQPVQNFMRLRLRRRWWSPWRLRLDTERGTDSPVPNYFPVAHDIARRLAGKIDGTPQSQIFEVLFNVSSTAHILGGCPIGADPADGVIDTQMRVFGYPGLYVVDGSVVPANLGVNPSLTITALAEHAMSHVPPRWRRS